jgi:membrane protein YqaA with SNARE-associated domain
MLSLLLLLLAVLVLNVLPAFAPPTWMVLTFYGFNFPQIHPLWVALVAALGATAGRLVLALFAQRIANSRWARAELRENMQAIADVIARRRSASVLAFLMFAISPLPSNVLFLAYGLTRAPLQLLALPFFIGRLFSYTLAVMGGSLLAQQFGAQLKGLASVYFLLSQLAMLGLVYAFTRVNWRKALHASWLRWMV